MKMFAAATIGFLGLVSAQTDIYTNHGSDWAEKYEESWETENNKDVTDPAER